ncbi:MAG TPA: hypothetical protein VEP93_15955 [Variovorax sp.]|nr:hypothetical protein [Variovorax sp.]
MKIAQPAAPQATNPATRQVATRRHHDEPVLEEKSAIPLGPLDELKSFD